MKEKLDLPGELEGGCWLYAYQGGAPHPPHTHDELEVNLVTRGTASYLVKDRRYDLRPRTQIWLFPEQDHVLLDRSPDYRMWILVFKTDLLRRMCTGAPTEPLLQPDPAGQFSRQIADESAARLGALFEELADLEADPPRFNAGLGYALLSAWAAHLSADQITGSFDVHPAIERAARLIRDETEPLPLAKLARQSGLSASRLSRLFKAQTGVSLVSYRQRIYLQRFLKIYGQGRRRNMLQAATESGFGSYPQFHRVFKQIMGVGPGEYRRHVSTASCCPVCCPVARAAIVRR